MRFRGDKVGFTQGSVRRGLEVIRWGLRRGGEVRFRGDKVGFTQGW